MGLLLQNMLFTAHTEGQLRRWVECFTELCENAVPDVEVTAGLFVKYSDHYECLVSVVGMGYLIVASLYFKSLFMIE